MHRIDAPGFAGGNLFTNGNPSLAIPATEVDDSWLNDVQEELCNVITGAGITLVKGTQTQLQSALSAYFGGAGVSVLAHGAKGDGTTDDTAAIQACIDANKGKRIVFPYGTYLCAGLSLADSTYNGTQLVCAGGTLKLKADGGSTNFGGTWVGLIVGTADSVYLDLLWDGNRSNMTQSEHIVCVGIAGASRCHIARLHAKEIRGDALYVGQSSWTGSSTDPTDLYVRSVMAVNSADDGRNAVSVISCVRAHFDSVYSYQVGGTVNSVLEPGGFDIEPDHGYENCTDITVGNLNVTTAGTAGFQILGKSISGTDTNRDWNTARVRINNALIRRTGTSGSGLAAANIIRCADTRVNVALSYTSGNYGTGYQVDWCDRLRGTLTAYSVTYGARIGPVGMVQDFDLEVHVGAYSTAGIRPSQVQRGRFRGRIADSISVSASTPFAIQCHNEGGTVTQTEVVYSVDAPYDSVASRAFRNEPGNAVTFANCEVSNCDFSGYSSFATMFEQSSTVPFRRNIVGLSATSFPTTGEWNQGELIPYSTPSANSGGSTLLGWNRVTTGNGNTLGTDWVNCYAIHQPTAGVLTPTNGGTVTPDPGLAKFYEVDFGGSVASATIANPSATGTLLASVELEFLIYNNSGGAITITWGGNYLLAGGTFTAPANGKTRAIRFRYNSARGVWIEMDRTSADA